MHRTCDGFHPGLFRKEKPPSSCTYWGAFWVYYGVPISFFVDIIVSHTINIFKFMLLIPLLCTNLWYTSIYKAYKKYYFLYALYIVFLILFSIKIICTDSVMLYQFFAQHLCTVAWLQHCCAAVGVVPVRYHGRFYYKSLLRNTSEKNEIQ